MCLGFPLKKKLTGGIKLPRIVPVLGIVLSIYMMSQCAPNQIIIGIILILAGIPIYIIFAPRTEIKTAKRDIKSGQDFFNQTVQRDENLSC